MFNKFARYEVIIFKIYNIKSLLYTNHKQGIKILRKPLFKVPPKIWSA